MRRLLIVSPHFPPVNAPDMQRARLALPMLRSHGWEPVVLAATPESVEGAVLDPVMEQTYPDDIQVVRVRGVPPRLTRPFGVGSLWLRCGNALRRAGEELLRREKFDLVFFTTTQFDAFALGPVWLRRFGVPYVLDYQDPWVNDYYRIHGVRPPGGRLKYWLSQYKARRMEPAAVRHAAGIVAVSSAYGRELAARYPGLDASSVRHIPFGSSAADIEAARRHRPRSPLIPFGDGRAHFVYAGRCGPDMSLSLTVLFQAFRRHLDRHPEEAARMRFHFVGTDYAPPPLGRFWAMPAAEKAGVADYVSEHCYRVPYFDALHYLTAADALMVVGSNDSSYSASKIFPYLLARRPLLTIVHQESLMLALAKTQGLACSYGFDHAITEAEKETLCEAIRVEWFEREGWRRPPSWNASAMADHTAEGMTARLAAVFEQAAARRP